MLIDAANEHELLLELCQSLGVRRVLETHGHWDHIQAVPAIREAGYEVAVTALDAPKLKDVGYDVFLDDAEVIEVGRLRLDAIHNPGHTPGSISFPSEDTPLLFTGDTLFPGGPGNTKFEDGDFPTIIALDRAPAAHVPRRHDRPARPRRRHDDRRRAPAPRRVDRAWLVADAEQPAAALRYDERPIDDTPVHTADLPPTPIRDRNIPATAWVEAPADLLTLGDDLPGTPVADYKRRIGRGCCGGPARHRRRRPLLGGPGVTTPPTPSRCACSPTARGDGRRPERHRPRRFRAWKEDLRDHQA